MKKNTTDKILSAGIIIIIAHVIFKFTGLIKNAVLGHFFDNTQLDAYVIAFEGVIFMLFLIGEESIGPAFLPVFSEQKNRNSETSAWEFASGFLFLQTMILLGGTAFLFLKVEYLVCLINYISGNEFTCQTPGDILAADLVRYMAPGLIGLSIGSTTYMILNSYKRFFWAALGDSFVRVVLITLVLVLHDRYAVISLGLGIGIGGFCKLGVHVWGLRDKLSLLFSVRPKIRSQAFRKFTILIAPLIMGILFAKLRDFFNNIIILNNVATDGIIAANSFGRKLYNTAGWFVPYGLSIAMFPYFCDMIDTDDRDELGRFMGSASRMLLLFFVPLTAIGVILSVPVVQLIFDHGKFSLTYWTATANMCYLLVLPFYSLEFFFMQGFFSDRRMITPTIIGIGCSSLSMVISFLLIGYLDLDTVYGPVTGIAAVALGYTVSRCVKVGLLISFFSAGFPTIHAKKNTGFLIRLLVITTAVAGATQLVHLLLDDMLQLEMNLGRIRVAVKVMLSACAGAGVFLLLCRIFRVPEFHQALQWSIAKIRHRKNFKWNNR